MKTSLNVSIEKVCILKIGSLQQMYWNHVANQRVKRTYFVPSTLFGELSAEGISYTRERNCQRVIKEEKRSKKGRSIIVPWNIMYSQGINKKWERRHTLRTTTEHTWGKENPFGRVHIWKLCCKYACFRIQSKKKIIVGKSLHLETLMIRLSRCSN